jgi:5-methylcytosine-specific restriction endonuclease McrA
MQMMDYTYRGPKMTRRSPYSKVVKQNQIRPAHVAGKGDTPFKGFQCPSPDCIEWIFLEPSKTTFDCSKCSTTYNDTDLIALYEFSVLNSRNSSVNEVGTFQISVKEYVEEAQTYKYCICCYTLKPLESFDHHASRPNTGRQGECRLCKRKYNSIKNQTRTSDQHREAAQKRRLYIELGASHKINTEQVLQKFKHKCFKCKRDISGGGWALDHTLPISYLWPLETNNSTILCLLCNGRKSNHWPNEFYDSDELKELSTLTGFDYQLLAGPAIINPDALTTLKDAKRVEQLVTKFAAYPNDLIRLRNKVLKLAGVDFFQSSNKIPSALIDLTKTH